MKIDRLSPNYIMVFVDKEELALYGLSSESMSLFDDRSRKLLHDILIRLASELGFVRNGKRLFIKSIPSIKGGCTLHFCIESKPNSESDTEAANPRAYKIDDCDALLDALEKLANTKNQTDCSVSVYLDKDNYIILLDEQAGINEERRLIASEYGEFLGEGKLYSAILDEHCKLLSENALSL